MSCSSGGANDGSSALAIDFQSWATTGRSPQARVRSSSVSTSPEDVVAGVGGDGERSAPAPSRSTSPARAPAAASLGPAPRRSPPRAMRPRLGVELELGVAPAPVRRGERLGGLLAARRRAVARRRLAVERASSAIGTSRRLRSSRTSTRSRGRRRPRPSPLRGGAAGRAARTRGRPRAGSRGRARGRHVLEVDVRLHVAHRRRERLRHARVVGVVGQVLLALGAGDLVDARQDGLEVAELLEQVRGGLVADARDAGDVVRGVALEAVEVGDQLGRDAVAVDDGVAVVDLRLGDAAAGRHHRMPGSISWNMSRSPVTTITSMSAPAARPASVAMTSSAS